MDKQNKIILWPVVLILLAASACSLPATIRAAANRAPVDGGPTQAVPVTGTNAGVTPLPNVVTQEPVAGSSLPTVPASPPAVAPTPTTGSQAASTPSLVAQPVQMPTARPVIAPTVTTLAKNLPEPDDLLVGPDGSLYVSDVQDGTIRKINPDGSLAVILSGINEPEGMLFLPDGSMLIVEQGRNRILHWSPATQKLVPFLDLKNPNGRLGVDGIALDTSTAGSPTLIIPDSPNDRLLRVSLDGQSQAVIASGLIRPTGAWVEPDGSLLVVEENGGWLDRVQPNGTVHRLAQLPTPDDVVEDASGNTFVTTLGDGAVHWIEAQTGQDHLLIKGLASPQGLAVDPDGNLVVTDPGHHRVIRLKIHA